MAVKNSTPSQLHNTVQGRVTIVNADGTSYKTVLTVTGSDSSQETHLYSITVTNDDSTRDLLFAINDGTNDLEQGAITIPATVGLSVVNPPSQVIANLPVPKLSRVFKDARGNWFVPLRSGETLKVKSLVTVTAAKIIAVYVFGWNFVRS